MTKWGRTPWYLRMWGYPPYRRYIVHEYYGFYLDGWQYSWGKK